MKKMVWLKAVALAVMLLLPFAVTAPVQAAARGIDPIVSTDWLEKNLNNPNLVIVDLRKVEEYKTGHVPGAVNVFYGSWAIKKGELLNELPSMDDLAEVIGGAGIGTNSLVVLVDKVEKVPDQFGMTRVAWTLKYAGVNNVAILNGGQNQWVIEKRALSQDMVIPKTKPYKAAWNKNLFVDKATVVAKLGKATIIDTPRAWLL